jgi:hypothetical protein
VAGVHKPNHVKFYYNDFRCLLFNDKRKRKLDENFELNIAKLYDILAFETDMMKAKEVTSACKKLATIKNPLFHPFM